MTDFCFIESNNLLDGGDVAIQIETACALAKRGHDVTLFLVQNGVMPARRGARNDLLTTAANAGVRILADDFSLRERGIGNEDLASGICASPLESVVDSLAAGAKTIWH